MEKKAIQTKVEGLLPMAWFHDNEKDVDLFVPYFYGNKVNLETMEIAIEPRGIEPDAEFDALGWPTINDLVATGRVEARFPYKEYDIRFGNIRSMSSARVKRIVKEFRTNGFNVTDEAVMHNYNAWLCDHKSGYRDEENGYHLFSPCGCNPFSLRATTLYESCADWQTTYEC